MKLTHQEDKPLLVRGLSIMPHRVSLLAYACLCPGLYLRGHPVTQGLVQAGAPAQAIRGHAQEGQGQDLDREPASPELRGQPGTRADQHRGAAEGCRRSGTFVYTVLNKPFFVLEMVKIHLFFFCLVSVQQKRYNIIRQGMG